ncbi:MAG TPA: efflux RND transporter periplasmic adaptor subunit [Methylomirabilota bacterium]|nr:efflux RND transporter periplasmic adaptor subunit [Methylomirabilota bacterium]
MRAAGLRALPLVMAGPLLAGLLLAGCNKGPDNATAKGAPPAVAVTVADVVQRDVPVQVRAIGNVQPLATVAVLSMINGEVMKVHFTEGQEVPAGALLFTIDPRQLEAQLLQAQANLAQQQAAVKQAEANLARDMAQLENARVEEERYRKLVEGGFVAREQYDQIRTRELTLAATIDADRAAVDTAKAMVRASEAAVENVRVQLGYTRIRSPIGGRTGNLLLHQGNVVKANDVGNPMVVINQIHPVSVTFAVPEGQLEAIKRYQAQGELPVEAQAAGYKDGTVRGRLSFVNNTVDPNTGTIQLKATFANTENALWPGQFVNVALTLTTQVGAVVVPSQAVQNSQKGQYVFVVKADQTVESRPVATGVPDGRDVVIASGLTAGERVVTDGQLRLVPGARVDVKPAAPAGKAAGAKASE